MKYKACTFLVFFLMIQFNILSQPNCEVITDSACKEACELVHQADNFPQGSRKSQELFDSSIMICPAFAYSYYEKSVPYLKTGLFKEWKDLIDKAVIADSAYLLERGINQVLFMRNYKGGLDDLNSLYEYRKYFNIGYSPSGEYHGQLIRAICYQKLGKLNEAIELMEQLMNSPNYNRDIYDYFHIGIAYLENNNLVEAKALFDIQNESYEYAETYYYYAIVYENMQNYELSKKMLLKAKDLYLKGQVMSNSYYHYINKIYLYDIEVKLEKL